MNVSQGQGELDWQLMALAIADANQSIDRGGSGVAALIARGDEVLIIGHNLTPETGDQTDHAELVVLRRAAPLLVAMSDSERADLSLYTTFEPCLMCLCACSVAGIKRVVYSAHIEDARPSATVVRGLGSEVVNRLFVRGPLILVGNVRREEGCALLRRMDVAELDKD